MSGFDLPTNTSCICLCNEIYVVAAVIYYKNNILAAKRIKGGIAGELWEFPGGKVEEGETPQQAIVREIKEELGIAIEIDSDMGIFTTLVNTQHIHLHSFKCISLTDQVTLSVHTEIKWCKENELLELNWPSPDLPIIDAILAGP